MFPFPLPLPLPPLEKCREPGIQNEPLRGLRGWATQSWGFLCFITRRAAGQAILAPFLEENLVGDTGGNFGYRTTEVTL